MLGKFYSWRGTTQGHSFGRTIPALSRLQPIKDSVVSSKAGAGKKISTRVTDSWAHCKIVPALVTICLCDSFAWTHQG